MKFDRGRSDDARRAVDLPGQGNQLFRTTHFAGAHLSDRNFTVGSHDSRFYEGKTGQFNTFRRNLPPTSAYVDLPSSILVHCPCLPYSFLAKIHDPQNSSLGVRGRR